MQLSGINNCTMTTSFQYYVTVGAGVDSHDVTTNPDLTGAEFVSMGPANDAKVEFYNFVDRTETLAEARAAKLVPLATFSYNEAVNPAITTGTTQITIPSNNTQGTSADLFQSLSGNADITLQLPQCVVNVPNGAIEDGAPTEFLITLEDRTTFSVVRDAGGSITSSPLGHGSDKLGGRERGLRNSDGF